MHPIVPPTATDSLPPKLYEELGASIKGELYQHNNPNFSEYSVIFNGNVRTLSKAVACPLDAEDVSVIVRFCSKHNLTFSIKAGGYGTHGFAVSGDIIVDLNKIRETAIETPQIDGSFTSLRTSEPDHAHGKNRASDKTEAAALSGKRRRDDDTRLRTYDNASHTVASFLAGSSLQEIPRTNKRRIEGKHNTTVEGNNSNVPSDTSATDGSSSQSSYSSSESGFGSGAHSRATSNTTASNDPSPPPKDDKEKQPAPQGDPFGYLGNGAGAGPPGAAFSSFPPAPPPGAAQSSSAFSNINVMAGMGGMSMFSMQQPQQNTTPVKPIHPRAFVTFGSGMRQKEIDMYTAEHPLEGVDSNGQAGTVPYHVPFSAHPVGSSIMLLGGFGFLSRLHGLSIDNLVEVEMVLADGSIIIVNEKEHPDLWWALRGAGSAFGVATRYKAIAYPVPVVYAGNLIYRFNSATAPSLIKHFRDCVKGAPRELYANVLLTAGPAGKDSLMVIQFCYIGSKEKGNEYLTAFLSWEGERCLLNEVDEKSFLHQQDSVAQVLRGKAGRQWFIRSTLITSLPDDVINETVMNFAGAPVGCTWLFELSGGAISDVKDSVLPKTQREANFTIAALHQWEMGVDDPRCIASAEEWITDTLGPVSTGGPYPCFLGRHEEPARTISAFGDNWDRLVDIKKRYDPQNVFKHSFWPLDSHGEIVDPREREPPTP